MASKAPRLTMRIVRGVDKKYLAYIEELPGCATQGNTLEEVRSNIIDAASAYLEAMLEYTQTKKGTAYLAGTLVEEKTYRVRPPQLVPS